MRRSIAVLGALVLLLAAAFLPASARATGLEWRGTVEGPYGSPWTAAERMRVLRWMPDHGFNAYVHAPKDDLYQRTNWRDPYPAAEQREFAREVAFAKAHGIEWIPNLSPAEPEIPTPALPSKPPSRDLCFSCPRDLEAVVAKLRPFLEAGSDTVMISFDDVTKRMTHREDLRRYGAGDRAFGEANGDFLTRLRERLRAIDPAAGVLTVGADYSGTADTEYLRGLRSTLAPGIGVMWTGTSVPSQHWIPADAGEYGRWIGRTPLVWDNWTDDDTAGNITPFGTARLFLGPYTREPAAAGAVDGFFFNPMNEADLNFLPLATAGDWMRDPFSYDARASWLGAVAELAPGDGATAVRQRESLRAWAETSWSNKLDPRDAPTFVRLSRALLATYAADGRWPDAEVALRRELRLVERAPARLRTLPDRAIAAEAEEFLANARVSARSGDEATALLAAERPALSIRAAGSGFAGHAAPPDPAEAARLSASAAATAAEARGDSEFTYGWRTPYAFDYPPYPVPPNPLDAFVDRALRLDAAWIPHAPQAASEVTVTLDGRPVALDDAGRFHLPATACDKTLVASDGAGGETTVSVPACA